MAKKSAKLNTIAAAAETNPPPPAWLMADADAAACWRELLPALDAPRPTDLHLLARYCCLWSRWRRTEADLLAKGATFDVPTADGKAVRFVGQRPEVSIAAKL